MSEPSQLPREFIPMARPFINEAAIEAVVQVLRSGWIVQGKQVEILERSMAEAHESAFAVAVSSATAGLHMAYLAMAMEPGTPCYIPSFAWPSAANMAVQCGYVPIFLDVDRQSCNLSAATLQAALDEHEPESSSRQGILVVIHEFGLPAPMDELVPIAEKYNLRIIEDAACAFGSTYRGSPIGAHGEMSVLSFHPRKSITTGEGGCVLTRCEKTYQKLLALRNHGQSISGNTRSFTCAGFNYRMTDFQAALGNQQIAIFSEMLQHRRFLAGIYDELLRDSPVLSIPTMDPGHSWQTYMVGLPSACHRDDVVKQLASCGIGAGPGSVAGHCLEFFQQHFHYRKESLPNSYYLHTHGLALPMFHQLTSDEVEFIAQNLRRILS